MERDNLLGGNKAAPEPDKGYTGVKIPEPWSARARQHLLFTAKCVAATALTIPGIANAAGTGLGSTTDQLLVNFLKAGLGIQIWAVFLGADSSLINAIMNYSFINTAKEKLDKSIKPIREESRKKWADMDGRRLSKEAITLLIYSGSAIYAGLASGAMSWDAFEEVPAPWQMPIRVPFSLLSTSNTTLSRFTALPGLVDNVKKRYNSIRNNPKKEDAIDIILALLAAAAVFAMFTQSGYKGVNILASKILSDPAGLTSLPTLAKIAIGAPAGLVSSAFYANNLLEFRSTMSETTKHLKQHSWEALPLMLLIGFSGFSGALLANVHKNILNNDNAANPNGNIFGLEPDIYGYSLMLAIFLFATMVNVKVIAKGHIDTPPELVRGFMKRAQSVGNLLTFGKPRSKEFQNIDPTVKITQSV